MHVHYPSVGHKPGFGNPWSKCSFLAVMSKAGRNFIKYAIQSNQSISQYVLLSQRAAINFWGLSSSTYKQIDATVSSYTGGRDNCQQPTTIPFYKQYLTPRLDWIWVHYLGVKRTESEADQSPQSSAKVKHTWRFNCSLHYILIAVRLSKQKTCT